MHEAAAARCRHVRPGEQDRRLQRQHRAAVSGGGLQGDPGRACSRRPAALTLYATLPCTPLRHCHCDCRPPRTCLLFASPQRGAEPAREQGPEAGCGEAGGGQDRVRRAAPRGAGAAHLGRHDCAGCQGGWEKGCSIFLQTTLARHRCCMWGGKGAGAGPRVHRLRPKPRSSPRTRADRAPAPSVPALPQTTQEQAWREDKISKAADAEKGAFIADGFGNPIRERCGGARLWLAFGWRAGGLAGLGVRARGGAAFASGALGGRLAHMPGSPPPLSPRRRPTRAGIPLGRLDATQPDPAGRLPAPGASLEEVQAFFSKLGAKPDQTGEGPFGKKPPFWERYQVGVGGGREEAPGWAAGAVDGQGKLRALRMPGLCNCEAARRARCPQLRRAAFPPCAVPDLAGHPGRPGGRRGRHGGILAQVRCVAGWPAGRGMLERAGGGDGQGSLLRRSSRPSLAHPPSLLLPPPLLLPLLRSRLEEAVRHEQADGDAHQLRGAPRGRSLARAAASRPPSEAIASSPSPPPARTAGGHGHGNRDVVCPGRALQQGALPGSHQAQPARPLLSSARHPRRPWRTHAEQRMHASLEAPHPTCDPGPNFFPLGPPPSVALND